MNIKNNVSSDIIMDMTEDQNQVGYDINEKDIDNTIHFLELNDPENATPERAIDFLAYLKSNLRDNAQADLGEKLLDLYNEFKNNL